jgi:hypothetical protein
MREGGVDLDAHDGIDRACKLGEAFVRHAQASDTGSDQVPNRHLCGESIEANGDAGRLDPRLPRGSDFHKLGLTPVSKHASPVILPRSRARC